MRVRTYTPQDRLAIWRAHLQGRSVEPVVCRVPAKEESAAVPNSRRTHPAKQR